MYKRAPSYFKDLYKPQTKFVGLQQIHSQPCLVLPKAALGQKANLIPSGEPPTPIRFVFCFVLFCFFHFS